MEVDDIKILKKQRRLRYLVKHADKIKAIKRQKYVCDCCNKVLNYDHKSRHEKTNKHQKNEALIRGF